MTHPAEGKRLADRIALADLPLFWRGRAKALRLLDAARKVSIDATLRQAETYDECADELAAALRSQGGKAEPVAWRYKCEHDGKYVFMETRLTDEQKARGYFLDDITVIRGKDGRDALDSVADYWFETNWERLKGDQACLSG